MTDAATAGAATGTTAGEAIAETPERVEAAPAAPADPRPHPLAGKAFWLGLGALGLLLAGATLIAAPVVSGPAGLGWFGAAFMGAGGLIMLEAAGLRGWGGTTGLVLQAVALLLGGLLLAFSPGFLTAPPALTAGVVLLAAAAGGVFCGLGAMGARGWPAPLVGAAAMAAAGLAMILFAPPGEPMLPCFAAGAALLLAGFAASSRAFLTSPPQRSDADEA